MSNSPLEATLPYSEFNDFNILPALVRLGQPDLELPSTLLLYFFKAIFKSTLNCQ